MSEIYTAAPIELSFGGFLATYVDKNDRTYPVMCEDGVSSTIFATYEEALKASEDAIKVVMKEICDMN